MDVSFKFFECSLCKARNCLIKKLPSCRNDICLECLQGILDKLEGSSSTFECPVCKSSHQVPKLGLLGFETHVDNIVADDKQAVELKSYLSFLRNRAAETKRKFTFFTEKMTEATNKRATLISNKLEQLRDEMIEKIDVFEKTVMNELESFDAGPTDKESGPTPMNNKTYLELCRNNLAQWKTEIESPSITEAEIVEVYKKIQSLKSDLIVKSKSTFSNLSGNMLVFEDPVRQDFYKLLLKDNSNFEFAENILSFKLNRVAKPRTLKEGKLFDLSFIEKASTQKIYTIENWSRDNPNATAIVKYFSSPIVSFCHIRDDLFLIIDQKKIMIVELNAEHKREWFSLDQVEKVVWACASGDHLFTIDSSKSLTFLNKFSVDNLKKSFECVLIPDIEVTAMCADGDHVCLLASNLYEYNYELVVQVFDLKLKMTNEFVLISEPDVMDKPKPIMKVKNSIVYLLYRSVLSSFDIQSGAKLQETQLPDKANSIYRYFLIDALGRFLVLETAAPKICLFSDRMEHQADFKFKETNFHKLDEFCFSDSQIIYLFQREYEAYSGNCQLFFLS